ncbi:hypothetical protein B9Z19DRAFT_1066334 [Tuber borchii]|uniref:Uncharacterized protein n=1 Tax=Tuber borchii TaxID=42251 RepID=A0A2T6ZMS7_TUBBO|nr:hypothetical protein B9Z19DRAFT_1066334 [Tuber borchii]
MYEVLGVICIVNHRIFCHNSIHRAGGPLAAAGHYIDYPKNAICHGEQGLFEDGDRIVFNSFTQLWMIIADELMHWLTEPSTSCTVNESMSDFFACITEHKYLDENTIECRWVVSAQVWPLATCSSAPQRSLKTRGSGNNLCGHHYCFV